MGLFHAPLAYPRLYAPYYDQFNFYDGREEWLQSVRGLPEKAIHLYSVHWQHWQHLEIYNGGFSQYFFNSTSESAPEAIAGWREIGMPEVAELTEAACARLGKPFPANKEQRRQIVGEPDQRMNFSDLDALFYELADTPQFFRRRPRFVPFADAYAYGEQTVD
jgi:hypothetical protein